MGRNTEGDGGCSWRLYTGLVSVVCICCLYLSFMGRDTEGDWGSSLQLYIYGHTLIGDRGSFFRSLLLPLSLPLSLSLSLSPWASHPCMALHLRMTLHLRVAMQLCRILKDCTSFFNDAMLHPCRMSQTCYQWQRAKNKCRISI